MEAVALDTHIVVWLYAGDLKRLRPAARTLESCALVYSPMVELELQYLFEIERITERPDVVIHALAQSIGLIKSNAAFAEVATKAREYSWTRDPFDRLIVASAEVDGLRLLTQDKHILKYHKRALNR